MENSVAHHAVYKRGLHEGNEFLFFCAFFGSFFRSPVLRKFEKLAQQTRDEGGRMNLAELEKEIYDFNNHLSSYKYPAKEGGGGYVSLISYVYKFAYVNMGNHREELLKLSSYAKAVRDKRFRDLKCGVNRYAKCACEFIENNGSRKTAEIQGNRFDSHLPPEEVWHEIHMLFYCQEKYSERLAAAKTAKKPKPQ